MTMTKDLRKTLIRFLSVMLAVLVFAAAFVPDAAVYADESEGEPPASEQPAEQEQPEESEPVEEPVVPKFKVVTVTGSIKYLKKDGEKVDLRKISKEKVGAYDTVQGGASDGKYVYYVLFNRNTDRFKVAKMDPSSGKLIKKTKFIMEGHGNDMTYVKDTDELVIVHYTKKPMYLTILDASTLKFKRSVRVSIPSKLKGATKKQLKKIKGFNAIAYNPDKKEFCAQIIGGSDQLMLDIDLKPIEYIVPDKIYDNTNQGIFASGEDLIRAESAGGTTKFKRSNIFTIYDWETGKLKKIANMKPGYEVENMFKIGKKYYAIFYTSYYQVKYRKVIRTEKVRISKKKVKYKKKIKVPYKVKYEQKYKEEVLQEDGTYKTVTKTRTAYKTKYKTKTKKVKDYKYKTVKKVEYVKYYSLMRSNYIGKLSF